MTSGKHTLIDSKKIQREYALGMHLIKAYSGEDGICRWMEDGDVVEFTAADFKGQYNAEFQINNRGNHKIWFSQLNGVFLNPYDSNDVITPQISFKDGTNQVIRNMLPSGFWNLVRGKKFRASVGYAYPVALNIWNEKVKELRTIGKIVSYIFDNLDNENYDAVKGMTKASRSYFLAEV